MSQNDHQRKLDALLKCSTSRLEIIEAADDLQQQVNKTLAPVYKAKASFESLPQSVRWISLAVPFLASVFLAKSVFSHRKHHQGPSHLHRMASPVAGLAKTLLAELFMTIVLPAVKTGAQNFVQSKVSNVFGKKSGK